MSFNDREQGEFTGAPITLLRFESDAMSAPILYTDITAPVMHGGEMYMPIPVSVGGFTASESLDKSALQLVVPTDSAVPMLIRYYPLGGTIQLTILYGHDGDPANEFLTVWSGRVQQVTHQDSAGTATLDCEPVSTSMKRTGLRRNYQRLCPHVLYGNKCRADKALHTVSASVIAVSGDRVTVSGYMPDGAQFKGGIINWTRNLAGQVPLRDMRMITEVSAQASVTEFKCMGPVLGLYEGDTVHVSKGCTHGLDACTDIFNNAPNYGGMPWIPTDNPSGGSSIY